jgi:hypothetical protein
VLVLLDVVAPSFAVVRAPRVYIVSPRFAGRGRFEISFPRKPPVLLKWADFRWHPMAELGALDRAARGAPRVR